MPQRSVQRARILLARADGHSQQEAARQIGVRRRIETKWCGRFRKLGLAGLADAGGRGRKPSLSEESRALILTQATRPPKGRTRYSVRSMARTARVSHLLTRRTDSEAARNLPDTITGLFIEEIGCFRLEWWP
jgi:transposase